MPTTMDSTATRRDVPVTPDTRVQYQQLPPRGQRHAAYRVIPVEPRRRSRDQ